MSSAATEQKSENASGGGGGSKLVLILTLVNLVGTLAMIGILFISFQRDKKSVSVEDIAAHGEESAHGQSKEAPKEGGHGEGGHGEGAKKKSVVGTRMVTLDPFTINLSNPGSLTAKLVRVNVSVEVLNEDAEAEVTAKMPQIRNAIIDLFNSKRPSDLATVDGRDYLKEEIKSALNTFLVVGKVKGIFFTNFALSG